MQRILWPRHYEKGEWFEFDLAEGAKEKREEEKVRNVGRRKIKEKGKIK